MTLKVRLTIYIKIDLFLSENLYNKLITNNQSLKTINQGVLSPPSSMGFRIWGLGIGN